MENNNSTQKFLFPGIRSLRMIKPSDIVYLQSDGNYTNVFFENGKQVLFSKTLKYFQSYLPELYFFRINHGIVVNKMYIQTLKNESVILENDKILPVSRRKKQGFISLLQNKSECLSKS